jgi:hypothetical protein
MLLVLLSLNFNAVNDRGVRTGCLLLSPPCKFNRLLRLLLGIGIVFVLCSEEPPLNKFQWHEGLDGTSVLCSATYNLSG